MEAVSAAASIAGLLSVAGHVINGIIKLNEFVQAAKEMDIRTESLNVKVGLLSETLADIKALLQSYEGNLALATAASWESNIASLRSHLIRCGKDLDEWAKSHKNVKKTVSKRQKFLDIIQNKRLRGISDMESKLSNHRSQLIIDIGTLNTASSFMGLAKLNAVNEGLNQLTELNLRSNANHDVALTAAATESAANHQELMEHISATADDRLKQLEDRIEEYDLGTRRSLAAISDSIYDLTGSISSSLERLSQTYSQTTSMRRISPPGTVSFNCSPRRNRSFSRSSPEALGLDHSSRRNGSPTGDVLDLHNLWLPSKRILSTSTVWSCGAAIGMDDYFIAGKTETMVHCLFCLQRLDISESLEQARHIIHIHVPAVCDQGHFYDSLPDFKLHLCEAHAAQHPTLDHNDKDIKCFEVDIKKSPNRRFRDLRGVIPDLELTSTPTHAEARLSQILSGTEHSERRPEWSADVLRDKNRAMGSVSRRVFWERDPPEHLIRVLYEASGLEESLNVNFNRPFPRTWAPIPEAMVEQGLNWMGMSLGSRPQLSQRWFIQDTTARLEGPLGFVVERQHCSLCPECCNATTYRGFEDAASHLQRQHFKIPGIPPTKAGLRPLCHQYEPSFFQGWQENQWKDDVASLIGTLSQRTSKIRKIYYWKLGVLARSDHLFTTLWCGAVSGSSEEMLLSSSDGAERFLMAIKNSFPWDVSMHSKLGDPFRLDNEERDGSSSWTKSDGAVDFNLSDAISREEGRSHVSPTFTRFAEGDTATTA